MANADSGDAVSCSSSEPDLGDFKAEVEACLSDADLDIDDGCEYKSLRNSAGPSFRAAASGTFGFRGFPF